MNEVFAEDGTFRSSVFYNVLGEDFIASAFKTARAVDPDAKLYINDYNLDSAGYAKTKAMVSKVQEWKAAGVPIDGIGSQGHLNSQYWPVSDTAAALKSLCAVADECAITELDIVGAKPEEYETAVQACLDIENCVGITICPVRPAGGSGANGADCSLNEKFKGHAGKMYVGVATDQGLLSNPTNEQIIIDNFGQVTAENRYGALTRFC